MGVGYTLDVRFQSTQYSVWYADRKLIGTTVPGKYPGWKDGIRAQRQSDADGIVNVNCDGLEVSVLQNRIFMYVLNDDPRAFDITNKSMPEDDVVTAAVEKLIEEGNLDVFLNALRYCCEYDYEYIYPFLARYSEGTFNVEEQERNANIDKDYIINLCKSALEKRV